jgi:DNA polymerase-3 subunit delta'
MHPDVVLLARGLYDPSLIGRKSPETQDLSIDQVRSLVLARAAFAPTEGRAKVFIVRRAEELSVPAANALLKTLEEPGPRTHFILLSSVGDALLPTIRSRVQRVRFGPLPESVVVDLLAERGVERERAGELARLAAGSTSAALGLADPEASAQRDALVSQALAAVDAANSSLLLDFAEQGKKLGKEALVTTLEAVASALAARARDAARRPESSTRTAEAAATRYFHVLEALRQLDANASAQLALEAMLLKMRG